MTPKLEFTKADLCLSQLAEGVLVQQSGREYLARKWQLTPQVAEIVRTAVKNGFSCLWVDGHPSTSNAHYICFARDHAGPWEFLIGGEAKPPQVRCITVNKRLRLPLSELSEDLIWQNFGGKHLFIEPDIERLEWVIRLLKLIPSEVLLAVGTGRRLSAEHQKKVGFQLEKHLEDYVFKLLISRGLQTTRQPKAFKSNRDIEPDSIPDIIVECGKTVFVVELKPNATHLADLHQLNRYATNKELIAKYAKFEIRPVLLAGFFHDDILEEATNFAASFELVSYHYADAEVVFKNVLGDGDFIKIVE